MRALMQFGSRFVTTWYFWAFVLLTLPNCILHTEGFPCEEGDTRPVCQEEKPPCPNPEDPKCDCVQNPETPECENPPCPDPENPDCEEPPCPDPDNPLCETPYVDVFKPGDEPRADSIMCDIPEPLKPNDLGCATQQDLDNNVGFSQLEAATALVTGQVGGSVTFDWSVQAQTDCGGKPKKVTFMGPYPKGTTVCLNCMTQMPDIYANPQKACIAKCEDLINLGSGVVPPDVHAYCEANARPSTNFGNTACYMGSCTSNGNPDMAFVDPRIFPEELQWIDFIGTTDDGTGSSLRRNVATTGQNPQDFNAGAASAQLIKGGDAWVEFSAANNLQGHVVSLRHSVCDDPMVCPDQDPTTDFMEFGIVLFNDTKVYLLETVPFLVVTPTNFVYSPTDRFRIKARDLHDGTAEITFWRLLGPCTPGNVCAETQLGTAALHGQYPLRVDASIRDENAILTDVTIVRIKE